MIKNIIFDMGGVLIPLDGEGCINAFDAIGAHRTADYVRTHRTEDLFYDVEMGYITTEQFCDEVRRIDGLSIGNRPVIDAWNRLLLPASDERKQRLLALRKEFRTFLLSNTNDMHWQYCMGDLFPYEGYGVDDYFRRIFLSYEMHLAKPNPDIYRQALHEAGLRAEETLFIDDNADNVKAAAAVGLHVYHNRNIDDWMAHVDSLPRPETL